MSTQRCAGCREDIDPDKYTTPAEKQEGLMVCLCANCMRAMFGSVPVGDIMETSETHKSTTTNYGVENKK